MGSWSARDAVGYADPSHPRAFEQRINRTTPPREQVVANVRLLLEQKRPKAAEVFAGTYEAVDGDFRPKITLRRSGTWNAYRSGGHYRWRHSGRWVFDGQALRLLEGDEFWLSLIQATDDPQLWIQVDEELCGEKGSRSQLRRFPMLVKTSAGTDVWDWLERGRSDDEIDAV